MVKTKLETIVLNVAQKVVTNYHKEQRMLSFWDIYIFLREHGFDEGIVLRPYSRGIFFRLMKAKLETQLNTPVTRRFLKEAGKTDNEYSNWLFKRAFSWGDWKR